MASPKDSISASSLLSSSPPVPSRPNPKPRNSETGDPMRRSFRGSPFPADLSRRNSIGRAEFGGDKENQNQNEKDHQSSNVVKAPKGSKNFMSPTISAVSKINPSPRKKVLSDKNELSRSFDRTNHHHQVKSCVSFSDVISVIGEEKDRDQICIDEKKLIIEEKVESHDITVTDYHESNGDFDDLSFKNSPRPPSVPYTFPVFGSQEADPLVAPYDPKKNYLSPRPQFLHYKPNPRIEHHFAECKQLEELFISESSSSDDTDLSAEESQQEEEVVVAVEEETLKIQEKDGKERLEAADIEETLKFQEKDGEERLEAAEIDDEEEEEVVGESIEEEDETHQVSKQSRFKISKLLGWFLALGIAYLLLVSSETIPQPNIIKDLSVDQFHIPPEITKSARESFEHLSEKLGMWAGSSLVYLDKLISTLGEEESYGPFQFHNLTDVFEDRRLSDAVFQPISGDEISVDGLLVDSQDWSVDMGIEEENGDHQEPENGGETNPESVYEEADDETKQESEGGGEVNSEMATEMNGVEGQGTGGVVDQKIVEEAESNTRQLDDLESSAITGGLQQEETEVAYAETVSEEEGPAEIVGNSFDMSAETSDVDGADLAEESGIGEVVDVAGSEEITDVEGESGLGEDVTDAAGSEEIVLSGSNQKNVIVIFSTMMVVLVAAAAAYLLAKKKAAKPVVMPIQEDVDETTTTATFEHVPVENLIKEKLSSLHFQEEEEKEEVVGDDRKREVSSAFPSEMSFSFHKSKPLQSCSNRDDLKEYQSGEGGKKSNDSGESMASSASEYSMGSVSYGSFTTYEKIQKKSGRKEAEMVTPVRRSSRIRSHQHSGQ